ncbi:MAG: hypothetical protein LBR15_09075 [Methanobrevibacter sp.]|jgi:SepF-like predicted cell division protein (DUF552 family)|nr:hypothetical protein [Candidatus Methanovirga australis]
MSWIDTIKRSLGVEEASRRPESPILDDHIEHRDEDVSITPEQSYYEIILIKLKNEDDLNYVHDQIVEEENPVVIDVAYLEKQGAEAVLLCKTKDTHMVLIAPNRVEINKKIS